MKRTIRNLLSLLRKKPAHFHSYREVGLTEECEYGCKIIQCACGEKKVSHRAIYGCKIDNDRLSTPVVGRGCHMMDVNNPEF